MISRSTANWQGTLKEGTGSMRVGPGHYDGSFTFASRFEDDSKGTNPEQLIGAAHAGCYSMFLSALISNNGMTPTSINTTATVHLGEGPAITKIELDCEASVPGLDDAKFQELAAQAKEGCPVSKALAGVGEIVLNATLVS